MNQTDIEAAWVRFMHRRDLTADLPTIWTFARDRIGNQIMRANPDLDEILSRSPLVYLHAGLVHLHELAQDDTGMARELQLFTDALAASERQWSLQNVTPVMHRPYYPEEA